MMESYESEKSDLVAICKSKYGWAVAEQIESLLDVVIEESPRDYVDALEDLRLNINAVRMIYKFLKGRKESLAKDAIAAMKEWQEYIGPLESVSGTSKDEVDRILEGTLSPEEAVGRGRMGGPYAAGPGGTCVCPECGAESSHAAGEPCTDKDCPECGAKMTRKVQ